MMETLQWNAAPPPLPHAPRASSGSHAPHSARGIITSARSHAPHSARAVITSARREAAQHHPLSARDGGNRIDTNLQHRLAALYPKEVNARPPVRHLDALPFVPGPAKRRASTSPPQIRKPLGEINQRVPGPSRLGNIKLSHEPPPLPRLRSDLEELVEPAHGAVTGTHERARDENVMQPTLGTECGVHQPTPTESGMQQPRGTACGIHGWSHDENFPPYPDHDERGAREPPLGALVADAERVVATRLELVKRRELLAAAAEARARQSRSACS